MSARWIVLLALGLGALAACTNDPFEPESLENQPPVARISVGFADSLAPASYNEARFAWSGSDVDGLVVGFWVSITTQDQPDAPWIFTTGSDTVSTWTTREDGTVFPTLHVVALDDRGALSDTARVAYPLVNTPPVLEYAEEFEPPLTSIAAADFDFFTFDPDGDDTLLPLVEYRYDGSDPGVRFDVGDTLADPAVGWVTLDRERRGFRLRLRDIPGGDPANGDQQTVYVRVRDDAGAATVLEYSWTVPEVRGNVLLVDDDDGNTITRDDFFVDAMEAHFGDQWTRIEATSLRGEPEVIAASIAPFDALIWYVRRQGRGVNIEEIHEALETYLDSGGKLYLDFQYVGAPVTASQLNDAFRRAYLGVKANPDEGQIFAPQQVANQVGTTVEIFGNDPTLPDLSYEIASGGFFDLWSIGVDEPSAAPLYRFEDARWSARCLPPCEPVVASRRPASGVAQVVTVAAQLELTSDPELAVQAIRSLWEDQLDLVSLTGPVGRGGSIR